MARVKSSNSSSVTSTDSWTLLDETHPEPDQSALPPEESIELLEEPPQNESPPKTRSNGFLSLDEFLQERLLEHDYEQDDKIEKLQMVPILSKEMRKCKAKNTGMMVFLGLILALSGFATLCSTLAVPHYVSELQLHTEPQVEVMKAPAPAPALPTPLLAPVFVPTEEVKIIAHSHPAPPLADVIVTNTEEFCYNEEQEPEPEPQQMTKDVKIDAPGMVEDLTNTTRFRELFRNHVRARLRLLKQILLDSNLQSLLSFVMINVYLITLIATLYKQQVFSSSNKLANQTADIKMTMEEAEAREDILKQLPFWGQELGLEKSLMRNKLAKLRKIQSQKRYDSRDFKQQIFESLRLLTKAIQPHDDDDDNKPLEEPNMKTKKLSVGQIKRDKVKLLKAKYSNEMAQIRERQMEEAARVDAMHTTSQKYMMKLKNSRDKYLLELRKVKEARQAREEHQRKDASVGSYAVAMPAGYSFVEKLRFLQEKENERQKDAVRTTANTTRLNCRPAP